MILKCKQIKVLHIDVNLKSPARNREKKKLKQKNYR